MQRFITPTLFFAAAGYVHWSNGQDAGQVLLFPFIDLLVPSTKGDPQAMGEASVGLLVAVGGVMLALALLRFIRDRSAPESE
ncbi:MAG: hypothetical protein H6739_26515 [Alphaproteobacteria bacterium]|nr:hypothetical protein [Alphaproteobacteria bacterium]